MSATTLPRKRHSRRLSSGRPVPKHYTYIAIGGAVFVVAWMVWNFWLGATLPP